MSSGRRLFSIRPPPPAPKPPPRFDLVIAVDWSAAADLGPRRASPDRCWLAWANARRRSAPEYFRSRHAACARLLRLLALHAGNALVAFDFPLGYPAGSGLGGGRATAAMIAGLLVDRPSGDNNRFDVAAALNRRLGQAAGPFWFAPRDRAGRDLPLAKPPRQNARIAEYRQAECWLRRLGWQPMGCWQLGGRGAVGGQMLTGLAALHRLARHPRLAGRVRFWPFETRWARACRGIVFAEAWPSLAPMRRQRHRVKDARQVAALRDWLIGEARAGRLARALARPRHLHGRAAAAVEREEGWLLGWSLARRRRAQAPARRRSSSRQASREAR